jgi:hypothetical protein
MTLPDILETSVLALTVIFIARWRVAGVLAAIPFGWLAIYLILILFPRAEDWEAREDWPPFGWLPMSIWCVLVLGVVSLWSRIRKRSQIHA